MTSAEGTTTTRRRIVVGVDGSQSSLAALRWAVRQAELTGAPLEIVSAWEWPVSLLGWETPLPDDYDPAEEARRQLDKAVSAVLTPGDVIEVRRSVIEGHPAPVLEAFSKTADLSSSSGVTATASSRACSSARSASTASPTATARSW